MPSVTLKKSRSLRATCERETLHNGAAADGVKGDDEKPEIGDAEAGLFTFDFRAISGVVRCSLPHDYPQIALLIQSHARSIDTLLSCRAKKKHCTEDLFH